MLKQIINSHWDVMRWIRLIAGVGFIISGFMQRDTITGLFGGIFLTQALFNVGCCGTSACGPNYPTKSRFDDTKDITYEEIK
ncbi:MAG: hypothetical protein U0T32_15055 [Chitinophagales bacterium]